jgi:hypothetical protein
MSNGPGTRPATRARAIDRKLDDLLEDVARIREMALDRVWKGNPHPDFLSALKAVEIEARLLGLLRTEKPDAKDLSDADLDAELKRRGIEPGKLKLKMVSGQAPGKE